MIINGKCCHGVSVQGGVYVMALCVGLEYCLERVFINSLATGNSEN